MWQAQNVGYETDTPAGGPRGLTPRAAGGPVDRTGPPAGRDRGWAHRPRRRAPPAVVSSPPTGPGARG